MSGHHELRFLRLSSGSSSCRLFSTCKPQTKSERRASAFRWPKNQFEAARNRELALEALRRSLSFDYHDCRRIGEVHTVGTSLKDRPSMSVYQVDGQCNDTTIPGWAYFCFDECFNVSLTDRPAFPPRPDYSKGAKNFRRIDAEV
jgi:hypothetical protein